MVHCGDSEISLCSMRFLYAVLYHSCVSRREGTVSDLATRLVQNVLMSDLHVLFMDLL